MDGARVPRYLHLPVQILWFDMEDIAIISASYALWLILDTWYALPLIVILPWLFKSAKTNKPRGFLRHLLYAYGVQKLTHYPPPHIEVFEE